MLTSQQPTPVTVRVVDRGRTQAVSAPAQRSPALLLWTAILAAAWLLVVTGMVRGGTIYVDSRLGNDRYDGAHPKPTGFTSGPVRSLAAAMQRVDSGDTVELANNGTPYFGSVTLFGPRHSGTFSRSFEIRGNGAMLSGAKPIGLGCWRPAKDNLWRVTPFRKAHYQLVRSGAAVPEVACERSAKSLPMIPAEQWCAWRGAVYFRAPGGVDPDTMGLSLADAEVGITLIDVDNVVIRDLTLQHFRLDGVNAHDRSRGVELVNVTLQENGRAGLAVGGTSRVVVRDCKIQGNREASVLVTELGEAELAATETDAAPTVVE